MTSRIISEKKDLAVFLKHNFTNDFNEEDAEMLTDDELMRWIIPHQIHFSVKNAVIDGQETYNYTVKEFPLYVKNAWGYRLFNIPGNKVVMNLQPYDMSTISQFIYNFSRNFSGLFLSE